MPIQTRNISVTISDFDGDPLEGARVEIKLVGLGNSPGGAVSPGSKEGVTDEEGFVSFVLWENRQDYSDTYYEISSYHPVTGQAIHKREQFLVFDTDADVKDLIGLDLSGIDPTQALLNQVAQDRAAAGASATASASSASTSTVQAGISTTQAGISTAQAVISTAQAVISTTQAGSALASSGIATTQAGVSTAQAVISTTKAGEASGFADSASNSAGVSTAQAVIATTQAGIATTKAGEASGSAGTATTQAGISTTQAGISTAQAVTATTQAGIATTKAGEVQDNADQVIINLNAAVSARNLAEKWASELEDVIVAGGLYSAFHWAKKAEELVAIATEGAVMSVNGQIGPVVTLTAADVGAATSAQGAKADSAVQPADLSVYVTNSSLATSHYTKAETDALLLDKASAAQGALADSALQPGAIEASPYIEEIYMIALAGVAL